MASKVAICNLALTELGANIITSLDASDTSKEADTCRAVYDLILDEVLEAHHWDFAKTWVALALDAGYTSIDEIYEYAYEKPADFIRFSRLESKSNNFEVRGSSIVSNVEDLEIEYIWRVVDPTQYPSHFIMAFVARLKASLVTPIARKGTKSIDYLRVYEELVLPRAKMLDAQQGRPSQAQSSQHTDTTDTWLAARSS